MVLTNLGIISFGNNSYGQCGRPIIENEEYFGNEAVIQNISNNFDIASGDEIVSIKCGLDHTCFLTKSGDVFTCGWASDGQLGQDIYTVNATPRKEQIVTRDAVQRHVATIERLGLCLSSFSAGTGPKLSSLRWTDT